MDANSGGTVASLSQQVQVDLVQEDIPGAALRNLWMFRMLLLCVGGCNVVVSSQHLLGENIS